MRRRAIGAVLVILAAAGLWLVLRGDRPGPTPVETVSDVPEVAPAAPVADATAEASGQDPAPAVTDAALPGFDLVRIAPDGSGVAAGHAAPGSRVRLRTEGELLAEVEADARGEFAALFDLPSGDAPQALEMTAQSPGEPEIAASETVLVTPPAAPEETAGAGEPVTPAPDPSAATATPAEDTPPAPPAADAPAPPPAAAPGVVVAGVGGARLMQPTGGVSADGAPVPIAIELISYAADGAVELSGRGRPGAFARLYIDNSPAATTTIGDDGLWRAVLRDVAPGLYTLRADEIGDDGAVVSRIETPFQRVAIPPPAAGPADPAAAPRTRLVTIQPGDTLWEISESRYGAGIRYVAVYEANRDKIRDPDLIYPGQIFDLPPAE